MDLGFCLFLLGFALTALWIVYGRLFPGAPKTCPPPVVLPSAASSAEDGIYHRSLFIRPNNNGRGLAMLLVHFAEAKKIIRIATFVLSGASIGKALEQAVKRGVKVKIIVDCAMNCKKGCDLGFLDRSGIQVRIFQDSAAAHESNNPSGRPSCLRDKAATDSPTRIFHQKYIVIDDTFVVYGSCNLSEESLRTHYENLCTTNDPRILGPIIEKFRMSWRKFEPSARVVATKSRTGY